MAETLRELVVALSLDSSNFARNMRSMGRSFVVPARALGHCAWGIDWRLLALLRKARPPCAVPSLAIHGCGGEKPGNNIGFREQPKCQINVR